MWHSHKQKKDSQRNSDNQEGKLLLTTKQEITDPYFKQATIGFKKKIPCPSGVSILWTKSNTLKYVLGGGRPGSGHQKQ